MIWIVLTLCYLSFPAFASSGPPIAPLTNYQRFTTAVEYLCAKPALPHAWRYVNLLEEALQEGFDFKRPSSHEIAAHKFAAANCVSGLRALQQYLPDWSAVNERNETVFIRAILCRSYAAAAFLADDYRVDVHDGTRFTRDIEQYSPTGNLEIVSKTYIRTAAALLFEHLIDAAAPPPHALQDLITTLLILILKRKVELEYFCGRVVNSSIMVESSIPGKNNRRIQAGYDSIEQLISACERKWNNNTQVQPLIAVLKNLPFEKNILQFAGAGVLLDPEEEPYYPL